jgi:hypothetical protein
MRALLWKECQENLKWATLPPLLLGGLMALLGPPALMHYGVLLILALFAALFAAVLGFVQVFFEAQGDRRALLLHRPLSRSHIFLGKALAGVGLYLLALGIPFACAVGWIATPGHVAAPFLGPMVLPWLADILAGVVYYFAGMLTAQREARWYGSRGLGLAAALLCSVLVWSLPEFWQALVAIGVMGTLVSVAAWGSFLSGGAYAAQPRLARVALAGTFLAGLLVLGVIGKLILGACFDTDSRHWYLLDRSGRVLLVHSEAGNRRVTDLQGQELPALAGTQPDHAALTDLEAPLSGNAWPPFASYRNPGRVLVVCRNETSSGGEAWFYVPAQGRLLGYDRGSRRAIGSFGPDGFFPPGQQPRERFEGGLTTYPNQVFYTGPVAYLTFPGRVYMADFARRTIRTLFTPAQGQSVLWAVPWKDEKRKLSLAVVGTDRSVHVVTESGAPVFAAPRVYDLQSHGSVRVGRLEDPQRFVVWYEPSWYLRPGAGRDMPSCLVEYDLAGREIARRMVPPRPLADSASALPLFGLVTPPAEAAVLLGAVRQGLWEAGSNQGRGEIRPLFLFAVFTTQYFIPGTRWEKARAGGQVLAFGTLMLLSALAGALICFLLARRYAFSRARCLGWALGGFFFGVVGLLLMLALQEWPARIACPSCRKPRVVSRERCEHCGAAHARPERDGTEVFEEPAATPQAAAAWN